MQGVKCCRKGVEMDRISGLPDSLLHHIFSFLPIKNVISTSLLSKRWRYLWTFTPSISICHDVLSNDNHYVWLDFRSKIFHREYVLNLLSMSLIHYQGLKIQNFFLDFKYQGDEDDCIVDSCVHFALERGVEVLDLILCSADGYGDWYHVPPSLFKCESLKVLKLSACTLNSPTSVCLPSLKTIQICESDLSDNDIRRLTIGCPLLEDLAFISCNRDSQLNIFAPNLHLRTLKIIDPFLRQDFEFKNGLTICAPSLLTLHIEGDIRCSYHITKPLKITNACLALVDHLLFLGDKEHLLISLLKDLHNVKTLSLSSWCVQVLSPSEIKKLRTISFSATCLKLETHMKKWELMGIVYALKSSPNLEHLILDICSNELPDELSQVHFNDFELCDFEEREYWNLLEVAFSSHLQHLKNIDIYGFMGSVEVGFTVLGRNPDLDMEINEFLRKRENEIKLVRFLLASSQFLHQMNIHTILNKEHFPNIMVDLMKELLTFSRASPDAKIFFS